MRLRGALAIVPVAALLVLGIATSLVYEYGHGYGGGGANSATVISALGLPPPVLPKDSSDDDDAGSAAAGNRADDAGSAAGEYIANEATGGGEAGEAEGGVTPSLAAVPPAVVAKKPAGKIKDEGPYIPLQVW
jgi:hypothetical protein